jgi:cell division transport system permease protein
MPPLRAIAFFLTEAWSSLRRGWRASALAMTGIVAAVFVVGLFLWVGELLNAVTTQWARQAEVSVYLDENLAAADQAAVARAIDASPVVDRYVFVSREEAAERFSRAYPDLAAAAQAIDPSPFPASFEIVLVPGEAGLEKVSGEIEAWRRLPGVDDVRYDQVLVERVRRIVSLGGVVAATLAAVLLLAAALAIISVVRLSYVSRREEIDVLLLVGAPYSAVRGPFVAEGWLQGTLGGLLAVVALAVTHATALSRYGASLAPALGIERLPFLSALAIVGLVSGAGVLGGLAGFVAVSRRVLKGD